MMPVRPPRPCRASGCRNLVYGNELYCELHRASARLPDERPSAARRGYDYNWKKLRMMVLREKPLCEDPFDLHGDQPVIATEVDHIVPLSRGGENTLENLQALCKSCHSRKTRKEGVGGGKSLEITKKRPYGQSKNHAREMEVKG